MKLGIYQCDGPGCREQRDNPKAFPLVLTAHSGRRARIAMFHAPECLANFVLAMAPATTTNSEGE